MLQRIKNYSVVYPANNNFNYVNICLLTENDNSINIPIKKDQKFICRFLNELDLRTGIHTNINLDIVNQNKHKKSIKNTIMSILLTSIILIATYINAHDYIICPFKYYNKDIWLSGNFKNLKYFYDKSSIPSYDKIEKTYNDYNFYVCLFGDCYYRNTQVDPGKENTNNFCLELSYSSTNYIEAESKILIQNKFLQTSIWDSTLSQTTDTDNSIKIGNFKVKIVFNKKYDEKYYLPQDVVFVAYDGTSTIRYCYQNELTRLHINSEQELKEYILKGFDMPW